MPSLERHATQPASLLTRARIGEIEISAVTVTEPLFRHCGRQVANVGTAVLLLETPVQGASVALQDGREARLAVGDFTLCDTARPYEVLSEGPYRPILAARSASVTALLRENTDGAQVSAPRRDGGR